MDTSSILRLRHRRGAPCSLAQQPSKACPSPTEAESQRFLFAESRYDSLLANRTEHFRVERCLPCRRAAVPLLTAPSTSPWTENPTPSAGPSNTTWPGRLRTRRNPLSRPRAKPSNQIRLRPIGPPRLTPLLSAGRYAAVVFSGKSPTTPAASRDSLKKSESILREGNTDHRKDACAPL
jgi:hypothetical protein